MLYLALRHRREEIVEELLRDGRVDMHRRDEADRIPLHYACDMLDHESTVGQLFSKTERVNARDRRGHTPLHLLSQKKGSSQRQKGCRAYLIELFLQSGRIDTNGFDQDGWTPLHHACTISDNPATVKLLLNSTASTDARDMKGFTPLHYAVRAGCLDTVKVLLDYGSVDIFNNSVDGGTVAQSASHLGDGTYWHCFFGTSQQSIQHLDTASLNSILRHGD
ncbi:ankyrin repeat-containing domain protein [Lasiosphaeria miniovina]|uniref:Ankyrin repeat-containing domain protein n=1 Tax=Lasiosphaeria miniovina TaxID=1954250 RepID=A0AA40B7F8_9PEZI|nr:ankyrin repeat-containing domain protein [Lasiosphaeria miniovina]KAK0728768.1 ankyrin repeat-containing domain protein [Lasiosphaeria miniovina]